MIFAARKSHESAGLAGVFVQLWQALRTHVEVHRMRNATVATVTKGQVLDLVIGGPARSLDLALHTDYEQFGVAEQNIPAAKYGIVRRANLALVWLEAQSAPNVGVPVRVSSTTPGAGTLSAAPSPRVGTVADITNFHAVNYPYVTVLLRRCTEIPTGP